MIPSMGGRDRPLFPPIFVAVYFLEKVYMDILLLYYSLASPRPPTFLAPHSF